MSLPPNIPILLNGRPVEKITAFLFHAGGHDDPERLVANQSKSFISSYVLGMGFTFDDSNPDATPIAEMHRLIAENPKNAEVIFPYIGGEEVNSSPTHSHHRYVINFGEMSEQEARDNYPRLLAIVEEKVKPQRLKQKDKIGKEKWWLFLRTRPELQKTIAPLERVLVIARTSKYLGFIYLPSSIVYSENLVIITIPDSGFSIIQSRLHELWVEFFSSTLGDGQGYRPSDCFETFPFPELIPPAPLNKGGLGGVTEEQLEEIGQQYYEYRAELMVRNNQGLTATYNRFHNPYEFDSEILRLRELHEEMDKAVLKAYGWEDIDTTCGFCLDYLDIDEEDDIPLAVEERIDSGDYYFDTADEAMEFDQLARTGKRKLPWRYRWPEVTHDEVLARLLELNGERAQNERLLGANLDKPAKKASKSRKKATDSEQGSLF